jgi:hypothetical protein
VDAIEFNCPECGRRIKASVHDFAVGRYVRCTGGHMAELPDQGSATVDVRDRLDKLLGPDGR